MKRLLCLTICVLLLIDVSQVTAKDDSLFPKVDEVNTEKPSLDSAIVQFEGIIASSTDGDIDSLKTNDEYNQQRALQLQQQLVDKKQFLETSPDIVSRQFDALMNQYENADQETKNKMADDLHAKWKAKEEDVKREIRELEEQLGITNNRMSEAAVKGQMLQISNSLAKSEKALKHTLKEEAADPQGESPAFKSMRDLSRKRILSKIHGLCVVQVKPLDTELSIKYLNN